MKIAKDGYPLLAGIPTVCAVEGAVMWNWCPAAGVGPCVKRGDLVHAGKTVVARLKKKEGAP